MDYIIDSATGCWVWQKRRDPDGYGLLNNYRKLRTNSAHRIYYIRAYGSIPDGLTIDHKCRNRACVNPDHMEPVTIAVNSRRGSKAKLTLAVVTWIRALRSITHTRHFTRDVAASLSVSRACIYSITTNRRWKE